jgi:malate synthase
MAIGIDPRMNRAPEGALAALQDGFLDFLRPLHAAFTPRQQALARTRLERMAAAHAGQLPDYLPPSEATTTDWRIELPAWCRDQRNQMTGPADDAELVVKMLNSGAPGVMLDLEDSIANTWPHLMLGVENTIGGLYGELTYQDQKRGREVGIQPSSTVIWVRARGLHLSQAGVLDGVMSASLFDVALVAFLVDAGRLKHPLAFYIPKSETAAEALFWRDLFQAVALAKGWPRDTIKAMALVESHALAYQMEEFLFTLREHILGLNLGRWDYMASLIHYHLDDPRWVLPDRNTIPFDVAFFQSVRRSLPQICHKHGALAVGGMTALFPDRQDAALNARALAVLEQDKRNEAQAGFDGAWTGHPDQNEIAVAQFPAPNQIERFDPSADLHPDLRPAPEGVGARTLQGTRAAVRTVIRYRHGVLSGRGASLLDGYMEDLATDRIYRLMIAQRMRHRDVVQIVDAETGAAVPHTPEFITRLFDEELERILAEQPAGTDELTVNLYRAARRASEEMILNGWFDPV